MLVSTGSTFRLRLRRRLAGDSQVDSLNSVWIDYRNHFRQVRARPGMWGLADSLESYCAYVEGVMTGFSSGPLDWFREFLVLRADGGNNLTWSGLVRNIALGGGRAPRNADEERAIVACLFDLLDEYLAEVRGPRDHRRLAHEYVLWLQSRDYYNADLERFASGPPGDLVTVDEAAASLGAAPIDVFDHIAEGRLRHAKGGEVLILRASLERLREGAEET